MSKRRLLSPGFNHSLGPNGKRNQNPRFRLLPKLRQLIKNGPSIAHDFINSWDLVLLLIAIEALVNYLVIRAVKYTEIDWSTYMAQVSQVFNGEKFNFDYAQISGPTGPLVYPAGHVYLFYLLKELTNGGKDIQFAQYIFSCIYLTQLIITYKIYSHKRTLKVNIED